MRKIRLNYNKESYRRFNVDLNCFEENMARMMKMTNNTLDFYIKDKMSKDEIDKWIKILEKQKMRANAWKSLLGKMCNRKDMILTDDEYDVLIMCLWENIQCGKHRLEDYNKGMFSWGKQMIPYEKADIRRRISLYERLEGKKYTLNDDSYTYD